MGKKSSSGRWMSEHLSDEYVKKAQKEGYRSRAVYKLTEVVNKDKFIKPGSRVLDLGAAPGGWSQVAIKLVGKSGQVIASDILDIEPIPGVDFLCGDFTEDSVYEELLTLTGGHKMDVVLSDMAPNMSGQLSVDIPKSMYLCELALDMAIKTLTPKGAFLLKYFKVMGLMGLLRLVERHLLKSPFVNPKHQGRALKKYIYWPMV
jgi:23S rRNA Um-2552 2''-O-methyltransferase (EC 2.1.1.-)